MSFLLILVPTLTSAHPGRTDSNGGHYCRTNCSKWGLKNGEYHYHNGGSNSGSQNTKKSEKTTQTRKQQTTKTQKKTEAKKKDTSKTVTTKKDNVITTPDIVLPAKQTTGTLRVYYFDVDQGDSTLIITPKNQTILIDGGNNDQGKNVVKYLEGLDIKTLDVMIATHPDADHIGGLNDVLKAVDVKAVYAPKVSHNTETYKDFLTAVKKKGRTIKTASAGVSLLLDEVDADFLAPLNDYGDDLNNWSAVLKLKYNNTSFLFAGDVEAQSENDMIANFKSLKVDVLKVGHHGSKTSTNNPFIDEVLPAYSIISVGKNNYGHPDSSTLDRLKNINSTIYRTDKQGTITAISNGDKISFVTTKK
jgi:beta-lactamase superfamily II metal-dependent hydrolase